MIAPDRAEAGAALKSRSRGSRRIVWSLVASAIVAGAAYFIASAGNPLVVLAVLFVVLVIVAALVAWGIWVLNNLPV
jgi:hypothetical protein